MTFNPITRPNCPNCGSTARVREEDIEQIKEGLIFSYSCGCGCKWTTRYIESDTYVYVQGI